MAEVDFEIPVIDFSAYSLQVDEKNANETEVNKLADQICQAFKTVGFVYLKNFGITDKKIQEIQELARAFFALPPDVKLKYARGGTDSNHGWVALEREGLNPERPGDLKEAFNVTPDVAKVWPDKELPEFKRMMVDIFKNCSVLSNRIHYLMGLGLKLKNPELFRDSHNPGKNSCKTTARLLYYPVLPPGSDVKPNQIRCGEHSDYGSITLLFQDDVGGLEVKNRRGEYVPAKPIPDTVIVNVGDLMQRWTSDVLVSTKHRVVLPKEEIGRDKSRISFAFFVHPDDDFLVECIDGSNKYEPITSWGYLSQRLNATYSY